MSDAKIIAINTPAVIKIGNNINPAEEAADISIDDTGGYYTSGNVNGALQEVGADLDTKFDTAGTNLNSSGTTVNLDDEISTVQYESPYQTLSISGGAVAWDLSQGQAAELTITEDAQVSNPTNINSITPILVVTQDGTGGHTLTFDTNFNVDSEQVDTSAGAVTIYSFVVHSDTIYGVGKSFT